MDMYVRMYDELKKEEGNNPTIGLVLCSDTSNDLARYSILKDSKQLFAAKYLTYLPTEEELSREIREQKEFFELQKGKEAEDEDQINMYTCSFALLLCQPGTNGWLLLQAICAVVTFGGGVI